MKELGVNAATLPVFSWAHLQLAEDNYNFEWLDQVLNLLVENAISGSRVSGTIKLPPKRVNILAGLD
jgi:beta-galactosidase